MKKFILALSTVSLFVACNQAPQAPVANSDSNVNTLDTAGLAAYHASKEQPNIITSELETKQESQSQNAAKAAPAKVRTITRYVDVPVKRVVKQQAPTPAPAPQQSSEPVATTNTGASNGAGSGVGTASGTETPAPAEQKKGWSKAAKGAVIGGVAGAVGGAIINKKNRGAGAVIGGIIGAAGGYGVGRSQDKKDGRIQIQ